MKPSTMIAIAIAVVTVVISVSGSTLGMTDGKAASICTAGILLSVFIVIFTRTDDVAATEKPAK